MNYYQEIRLLPDAEANLGFLWQKVYQQIHIALVENKNVDDTSTFGLSIPDYFAPEQQLKGFPLGDKIRLFAKTEEALSELDISKHLIRLEDYAQVKSIKPVPEHSQYACFTRVSKKGKKRIEEKTKQMAEFKAKETGEPFDKWFKEYSKKAPQVLSTLPFIQVARSIKDKAQGKNSFKLFIEMELVDAPVTGDFNCYGLNSKSQKQKTTVPWF